MSRRRQPVLQVVCAAALCGSLINCAKPPVKPRDAPYVEVLRLKITKVRHAIDETRETIARSRGAPYLPELYLRLAELMSEEARYHYRVAAEREQASREALHVPQVRVLKEQAIGIYRGILRDFPDSPLAPQVLFNIGHEHRELGNFDKMREAFEDLIAKYPTSRYRYDALLVLGDYHFDRAEFKEARKYYDLIAKGETSHLTPLAHYRVAWVWVNEGECKPALEAFEAALDAAAKMTPEEASAAAKVGGKAGLKSGSQGIDVRRASLVDLAYCYSQERKSLHAVEYVRKRAYDRATYVAALEQMARRFGLIDDAIGSVHVVRELLRLGSATEERLEEVRQLHASIRALKDYAQVGTDVRLMVDVLNRFIRRIDVNEKRRKALREEFEAYCRDVLTRAQDRREKVAKKKRDNYLDQLNIGYRVYLDTFVGSEEYADMVLNAADMLSEAKIPFEAGQRFLQASSLLVDPKQREDALYNAVVRFQEGLDKNSTEKDHPDRVVARGAMRNAGTELLRYPLKKDQERRVKFALALTYYDEGRYQEAIDRLTAVAYEYPRTGESKAAIRLVLDSHKTINDFQGLIQAGHRFMAADSPADDALKAEIKPIVAASEQRMIDELSLEAAGVEGVDLSLLIAFGQKNKGTELGERAMLNAFVAARAVGDTDTLYKLGGEIAAQYPDSEQLPGMLSTLGQAAVARFEFDRAVKFLRKTATSKHPQRVHLLVAAGEIEEGLGDEAGARERYLEAAHGAEPRARTDAVEHLAKLVERSGNADEIIKYLSPFADDGDPEVSARLGLAQLAKGDKETAESTLNNVLAAGASASGDANARAHFGMAELLLGTLEEYPALNDPELISEYITIVDVAQQSYLNAARQGSPEYTAMAFGRLVYLAGKTVVRLEGASLGSGELSEADRKAIQDALKKRSENMRKTAKDALTACSNLAWTMRSFSPMVRECMKGSYPRRVLAEFDHLKGKSPRVRPKGVEELRDRLSRNPEDLKAMRELAGRFLAAGDPYSARLVLVNAAGRGGGAEEANLLGIAAYKAGITSEALSSFAQAAEGGLEAGRQNLVAVLRKLDLESAARKALKQYQKGRPGGELLPGVGVGKPSKGGK